MRKKISETAIHNPWPPRSNRNFLKPPHKERGASPTHQDNWHVAVLLKVDQRPHHLQFLAWLVEEVCLDVVLGPRDNVLGEEPAVNLPWHGTDELKMSCKA
jgi:hypothetical protein